MSHSKALTNSSISPQHQSTMLARPMTYRHHHHCLSRHIPHLGVHRVCPRIILILDSQSSKNIGPLPILLSWMPYLILKEYRIPKAHPILHSFFQSEDKNDVSITPSQLGRIYPFLWRNVPIPIKGMYPNTLLSRDLSKLPLSQGTCFQQLSALSGDHGTISYLWVSFFDVMKFIFNIMEPSSFGTSL